MSSLMGSHGVILAAAMAVSGTVLVLVLCRQRPTPPAASVVDEGAAAPPSVPSLRPCISGSRKSEGKAATKKQKRVYFAEEVFELRAEGCNLEEEEEKREESLVPSEGEASPEISRVRCGWSACGRQVCGGMPANRLALYSGILRDRHLRMTCSY